MRWARPPSALASGRPPRAPSPPSPTSSPPFIVRLIDCLCSLFSPCMYAPPPPAGLLRMLLTTATFSSSRHHHQTWRRCTWSPYATAASRRQSRVACVTVQAPFNAFSLSHDHNPITICLLRESSCFAGRLPEHEQLLWGKNSRKQFFTARPSTVPEQRRP